MEVSVKKNLEYRGMYSTELQLCLLVWFTTTYLLIFDKVTEATWLATSQATVFAYIVGRVGSKMSEAYRDAKQPQSNYTPGVV
jgi:hypothetical protein